MPIQERLNGKPQAHVSLPAGAPTAHSEDANSQTALFDLAIPGSQPVRVNDGHTAISLIHVDISKGCSAASSKGSIGAQL